jgi:diguanylate cyclase (GGDEF)-like protein
MPSGTHSGLLARSEQAPSAGRVLRALGPFAGTAALAWVAVLIGAKIDWALYGISVVLVLISLSYGVYASSRGRIAMSLVIGSFGFLAAVGLLRQAAGGSTSGVSAVALLAVFQTALYVRGRRALAIVLLAMAALYLVPIMVIGPPLYPHSGYRGALIMVAVSSIIGLVSQNLVQDIRSRAIEARSREQMMVQVNERLQSLFDSSNARSDICQAVLDISGASAALIFEPGESEGSMLCSATTVGDPTASLGTEADPNSAAHQAFRTGRPVLLTEGIQTQLANIPAWEAAGKPTSALYQPLLKDDVPMAVLVVAWHDVKSLSDPRVVVASLLAHEGGRVLSRADVLENLADEAHTDPLTKLPNRRAWDARLSRAMTEAPSLAMVMLDLDHFKRFNDSYGHPEGDRLLRDAATAWNAVIRPGEFLARLGGEEFGLLVFGSDLHVVEAIVDRVRACVPQDQTCSAGIAVREPGESSADLVDRADRALYEAKTGGRDRACISPGSTDSGMSRSTAA